MKTTTSYENKSNINLRLFETDENISGPNETNLTATNHSRDTFRANEANLLATTTLKEITDWTEQSQIGRQPRWRHWHRLVDHLEKLGYKVLLQPTAA